MFKFLNFFKKKKEMTYQSAINLVYERNIHTLRRRVKILIVDDENFDLVQILEDAKYDIYYKKDIKYTIEVEAFDIVIIDILGVAPALQSSMEGFAMAEEIKKRYPAKQVWCYSGKTVNPAVASRLKNIDGYIPKDTDIDQWRDKLDRMIETYCSDDYQIKVLRTQLEKYGVRETDINRVIEEYKKNHEAKNFNSVIDMISGLITSGKQVLELIKLIYSFAEQYTV